MSESQLRFALKLGLTGVTLVICLFLLLFPLRVVAGIFFMGGIMTVLTYITSLMLFRFFPHWFRN